MKLDILAFGAHPDDVELGCAGTILKQVDAGYKVGIVDLTKGELGTRGTLKLREAEAKKSAEILGVSIRENLGFADGFFTDDKKHQLAIIKMIRKYRPDIVLANALEDRHPDHGRAGKLIADACFLAGLLKINTQQALWRPIAVYHYLQFRNYPPGFVVDITPFMEKKMAAVKAFSSQFYNPDSKEPPTTISSPDFLDFVCARAQILGKEIGAKYAEGFTALRMIGVKDIGELI